MNFRIFPQEPARRQCSKGVACKVPHNVVDLPLKLQDYLEGELGRSEWSAGDSFSAADIRLSFPVEAFAARRPGHELFAPVRISATVHARSVYRRALQHGGHRLG